MADNMDEIEMLEYLEFMEVLNANEHDSEVEDVNNLLSIEGTDEEIDASDGFDRFEYTEFNNCEFKNDNGDILQCIINMIELEYMLATDNQQKKPKRKRRWGVHPINQLRMEHGHFNNLYKEMIAHDHEKFFNFTRMSPTRFEHLLSLVGDAITKTAPNALPPKCRLLITLR